MYLTGYTFKEEMINDAILRAIEVFDNYDPEKFNRPFAYFTLVMWRTFLQRIQKEKQSQQPSIWLWQWISFCWHIDTSVTIRSLKKAAECTCGNQRLPLPATVADAAAGTR